MAMTRRSIWFSLRGSLWFIPAALMALGIALALGLVQLDIWLDAQDIKRIPNAMFAGPEGARQILSVIAGSSITVAGVIFSITIVTLSLAAAQYSPRVLRSFMRDRVNQWVLGILVLVFVYNLLVLRAVRTDDDGFVPQISLWFGILLVFVAIGFFIAFIHNTAVSIQAPEIVSRITDEALEALEAVRHTAQEDKSASISKDLPDPHLLAQLSWRTIPSRESGYIQDVDVSGLFDIACHHDVILHVILPVGEFVVEGRPLVRASCPNTLDDELIKKVQQKFGINSYRTVGQDPAFGVRQLVDIALKALSPSMNDTTTAIHCVDYLSVILHRAAKVEGLPQTHRQGGKLRLITPRHETAHFIDLALNEIRQSAQGNVAVLLRLFRLCRQVREDTSNPVLRRHIREHIELLSENIDRHVACPHDRRVLRESSQRAIEAGPAS
ncbi:DUF2254 domain-containing protein [Proteobacteria bacterium 005FR1]|nr:DUF2254 domain-containing protein [Proteobacteria bacterium 005FR1]